MAARRLIRTMRTPRPRIRAAFAAAIVLLLAASPVAAQDPSRSGDGEFDPTNPGEVKRLLVIELVSLDASDDLWSARISGKAEFDDGTLVQLVLRYPAVDPSAKRGVAWGETFALGGRFEGAIEFRGQVLFPGIYEALAVMSGPNQPPELAEKYGEAYHEANHLFYHGTPEEAQRAEEVLRSYYFLTASEIAVLLQDVLKRCDDLVAEPTGPDGKRTLVPERPFDEKVWRTWLDDEWRVRMRSIEALARHRRDILIAPRFPEAMRDLEALARSALEVATLLSRRVYAANKKEPHEEDGGVDPESAGNYIDKWSYAMDLVRSIEKTVGVEILDRPTLDPGPAKCLETLEAILRERKPERLAALAEGGVAREIQAALGEFLESRWVLDDWRVLRVEDPAESSEATGAGLVLDIRFLAADRARNPIAGVLRLHVGPGADPASPWRILASPQIFGDRIS